jgi:molybdate transport system ATP-binding protein
VTLDAEVEVSLGTFTLRAALRVEDDEVVAVLGPNGSGKTTLLRTLAGLQALTTGRIVLDGETLDDPSAGTLVPPEHRSCGLVFQDYLLFPHLTAEPNVAFGLRSRGRTRAEAHRTAADWLRRIGLADHAASKPDRLSGGQAQQVALARALATQPRLLLLDEPMAALDVSTRAGVRHRLRHHLDRFGGSTVLVTHDPLDAAALADRLVVLEAGRCVQEGTLEEITARPRTPYVAALMGRNLVGGDARGTQLAVDRDVALPLAAPTVGPVLVAFSPRDVVLHRERPPVAAPGTWSARVVGVELLGDRARVELDVPTGCTAEVSAWTLTDLRLTEGSQVWADVTAEPLEAYRSTTADPG